MQSRKVNKKFKSRTCKEKFTQNKDQEDQTDKELIKITENIEVPDGDSDDSIRVFYQSESKDEVSSNKFHVRSYSNIHDQNHMFNEPYSPYQSHCVFMTPHSRDKSENDNDISESQLVTPKDSNENPAQGCTKLIPGKIWNTRLKDYLNPSDLKQRATPNKPLKFDISEKKERSQKAEEFCDQRIFHENFTTREPRIEKGKKSRRNASLEIMLENGKINSHRNMHKSSFKASDQGCFEVKDLKVTKNMMSTIQKRTRAAVKQAMQGEQKVGVKNFKVLSPAQKKRGNKQNLKNAKSRDKFTNIEQVKLEGGKNKVRRVSQDIINTSMKTGSIKSSKKSIGGCQREITSSRMSHGNSQRISLCSNRKKNLDSNILSINSNLNIIPYKEFDIKGNLNQLDISPEEFTITELNNPDEDTMAKSSSVVISSIAGKTSSHAGESSEEYQHKVEDKIPHQTLSKKNTVLNSVRRKLNEYYNRKAAPNKTSSPPIIIEKIEGYNEQDEAKIIETEEAEENSLFMHRNKENKEISSIDITNGIGEISDFNSEENYILQANMFSGKTPSFITDSETSSGEKGTKFIQKFKNPTIPLASNTNAQQRPRLNNKKQARPPPRLLNKYLYEPST
ncbi:unnamed protein product [Moneuplotes crassus]|uniref:Uncharacterized protein n=1 Tax=Euplotes crassus TaxID=5936 RepID=A0AAD1U4M5_EUPCR|nr:unnamed protein product [Moneuplotes crassus]